MIKTGDKRFWTAQLLGWGLIGGSNLLVQYMAELPADLVLYNAIVPLLLGLGLTSAYRYFIRRQHWRLWSVTKMLGLVVLSTVMLAGLQLMSVFLVFKYMLDLGLMSGAALLGNFMIFSFIMLSWTLIYFSVHYFNNWMSSQLETWQLLAEKKDAELAALKLQINPHFVFNSINNIRALILEDKDRARDMLLHFSDLFRYALQSVDKGLVPLEEELEVVQQYLDLQSIQYEDKLQYKINVDQEMKAVMIPAMSLQLLVENAIKHGISQLKLGGELLVGASRKGNELCIRVANTHPVSANTAVDHKLGVGLDNIRKRLKLMYKKEALLSLSEVDNMFVAEIKIPCS